VVGAAGEPPQLPHLVARPVGSLRHVFVVAPEHPLARLPEPLTSETVARHRGAVISDTSRELKPRSVATESAQECIAVPTLAAKLAAQCEGLAVGTVPECLAAGPIAQGKLVAKRVAGMREVTQCYVAWRDDETGRALRWWVEQLNQPDLIDQFIARI
jgi:DNA-binding transcriptional LysR family regulator